MPRLASLLSVFLLLVKLILLPDRHAYLRWPGLPYLLRSCCRLGTFVVAPCDWSRVRSSCRMCMSVLSQAVCRSFPGCLRYHLSTPCSTAVLSLCGSHWLCLWFHAVSLGFWWAQPCSFRCPLWPWWDFQSFWGWGRMEGCCWWRIRPWGLGLWRHHSVLAPLCAFPPCPCRRSCAWGTVKSQCCAAPFRRPSTVDTFGFFLSHTEEVLTLTKTLRVMTVTTFILVSNIVLWRCCPCCCFWGWCGGSSGSSPIATVLSWLHWGCAVSGSCLCTSPSWPGTVHSHRVWSWFLWSVLSAVAALGWFVGPWTWLLFLLLLHHPCSCVPLHLAAPDFSKLPRGWCRDGKVDGDKVLCFVHGGDIPVVGAPPVAWAGCLIWASFVVQASW